MALIIDAPMPPSCRWHNTNGLVETCPYLQSCYAEFNFDDCRPSDCPIIGEIPDKHGDLIERQAVLSYFETAFLMGADMDYADIVGIVSNPKAIPTILEASK